MRQLSMHWNGSKTTLYCWVEKGKSQNICSACASGKKSEKYVYDGSVSVHLCLYLDTSGRRGVRLNRGQHGAVEFREEKRASISALYTLMCSDSLKQL